MSDFSLQGRSALVTGSSHGIGQAIAEAMAASGAKTIFHSHDGPPEVLPAGSHYIEMDLLQDDAPRLLFDAALQLEPELNILVSNAGGYFDTAYLDVTPEIWERTLNLNVRAGYFLIQAFARHLIRHNRRGAVVIVTSTNGFQAEYDSTVYDISKGGLVMMTRTLALNLAAYNIRVNAIAPGLIYTPFTAQWIDTNHTLRAHYEKNIPLGRIGRTDDCASAAVFLASEAARYITGQVLAIDGGLTIQQIGKP